MPLSQWDCPTGGCHGTILCAAMPHAGQVVFCRSWGTLHWHCGRAFAWDGLDQHWVSAERVAPELRAQQV